MEPSSVTQLLYKQLNYTSQRQKVISANIANIDTPDYKTKDLRFKNEMAKAGEDITLDLKCTNKHHIQVDKIEDKEPELATYRVDGLEEQNDGNNVNLDTQMSQQAQNSMIFSAIQNSIKKDAAWFKSVIDASGKN